MDQLTLEATTSTPFVNLNSATHTLEFSGVSRPEDSSKFFFQIINWLNSYKYQLHSIALRSDSKTIINATFNLSYYNSSSKKFVMEIFFILCELDSGSIYNSNVVINWLYHEDDEDAKDAGEEYEMLTKLKFNYKPYSDSEEN